MTDPLYYITTLLQLLSLYIAEETGKITIDVRSQLEIDGPAHLHISYYLCREEENHINMKQGRSVI
jgi:hypothetical protein